MTSWKKLFGLWILQGIFGFCWIWLIPTDTENPLVFGFSTGRLVLLGMAFLITIGSAVLFRQSHRFDSDVPGSASGSRAFLWDTAYVLAVLVTLAVPVAFITLNSIQDNPDYHAYAMRLLPLFAWFGVAALEFVLLIMNDRYKQAVPVLGAFRGLWKRGVVLSIVFLLAGWLIIRTGIGISPDKNFGDPAIPVFEWQILLTLLIIAAFAIFLHNHRIRNDKWIPLGVYAFTLLIWLAQPINPAFTATPPRAPAFEIFPFTDALIYAQYAQSALIGNGFLWPEVPARPFYIAFLTWLHLFGGQNYPTIIVLQTIVLAAFPVVLYFLGREFGGRPLGLGLSLFAVFRDINSNKAVWLASNVTYSKLLLSELPVALLLSLVAFLAFRWLRQTNRISSSPLLIGGILGVSTLIRTQSVILLFVILFLAFFVIPSRRQWIRGSILVSVGFILTFAPWLVRNYAATGGLAIDNPLSQTVTLARRWNGYDGEEILARLPNESDAQYSYRAEQSALEALRNKPLSILQTAANHSINNEVASALVFPVRDAIHSAGELVWPQHMFWRTPLTRDQLPLFSFYIFLFIIGVGVAWQRYHLPGLLPLAFNLTYNFWTGLFFSSGERFVVPVDWGFYLYQLFGLLILGAWLLLFTLKAHKGIQTWLLNLSVYSPNTDGGYKAITRRSIMMSLIVVVLLGAFTPFTEIVFPKKYPPKTRDEIIQQIGQPPQGNEIVLYGRAIYPRYYRAGDGEPGTAKLGYGKADEARLVFYLIGPSNTLVIFDLKNSPAFFPHASDVYMIGTQMDGYFSPRVVRVISNGQSREYINRQ